MTTRMILQNGAFEVSSIGDAMAFVKALVRRVLERYKQKLDATEDDSDEDDDEESFSTKDTETRLNDDDPASDGVVVEEEAGKDDDDFPERNSPVSYFVRMRNKRKL